METRLKKLVESGLNNIEIAKMLNVHRTTIGKYLKKYNIKRFKIKNINCGICDRELGDNPSNRSNCGTCITRIRRYRNKKRGIEYLGGKCIKCGFNGCMSAFDFHHVDWEDKDFAISQCGNKSWFILKKELDKCILLCANCHRKEHTKYSDIKLLEYINK